MKPAPRPPQAPRWPVLLSLSSAVLAAHLWLLAGDLSLGTSTRPADTSAASANEGTDTAASATASGTTAGPAPFGVPAVTVSTVRWIPPAPAAPTASAPPPARSAPPAERRAAAMPERPMLRDEIAIATPVPVEQEPAEDLATAAPAAEPPPVEVAAAAPPPPAEPPPMAKAETATEVAAATPAAAVRPDTGLPPVSVPGSAELLYDISGQAKNLRYNANARLLWKVDGNRYEAELEISAFLVGSRVQTSRGRLGQAGLEPERFSDRRRSAEKAAHFDHASQRIRFSNNAPDAQLRPGAQDRLSIMMQLAGLLNAHPEAFADGTPLSLQVAGTGGADEWRFVVGSMQELELPAGKVSARKLTREPRHEHDSRIEIWLAPAWLHLPVRIRVTEADGSQADQRLRQFPTLPVMHTPPIQIQ